MRRLAEPVPDLDAIAGATQPLTNDPRRHGGDGDYGECYRDHVADLFVATDTPIDRDLADIEWC